MIALFLAVSPVARAQEGIEKGVDRCSGMHQQPGGDVMI
jgi:hypothetical protein